MKAHLQSKKVTKWWPYSLMVKPSETVYGIQRSRWICGINTGWRADPVPGSTVIPPLIFSVILASHILFWLLGFVASQQTVFQCTRMWKNLVNDEALFHNYLKEHWKVSNVHRKKSERYHHKKLSLVISGWGDVPINFSASPLAAPVFMYYLKTVIK